MDTRYKDVMDSIRFCPVCGNNLDTSENLDSDETVKNCLNGCGRLSWVMNPLYGWALEFENKELTELQNTSVLSRMGREASARKNSAPHRGQTHKKPKKQRAAR